METMKNDSQSMNISSTGRLGLLITSLALASCGSAPVSPPQYTGSTRIILPEVTPTKEYMGKGPLGDPICRITYSTGEKILKLCDIKLSNIIRTYSKNVPGTIDTTPQYKFGFNPQTRKIEYYYDYSHRYTPSSTKYCTIYQPYSQRDGSQLPKIESCY